ncbi:hypothetical protein Tco_1525325 [Tanacetum coccineum]
MISLLKILRDSRLMTNTRMIGFMNGTKTCHGYTKNWGSYTEQIQIGQEEQVTTGHRGVGSFTEAPTETSRETMSSLIFKYLSKLIHIRYVVLGSSNKASVSVMPLLTYLNLGLGELAHTKLTVELADKTVKYPKGIAKNVLIARLMGETLVLNRSLDPFFEDYIEQNDLNVPLELRIDQVDDLMPTIKEGQDYECYEALEDGELKDEALRNKAIMEGTLDDDDEFKMIKYSFEEKEEYVDVKEDEYNDFTSTSKDAGRAYQEIFRMMDEG